MSVGNVLTKLNRKFGVGFQRVYLYRIRRGEAPSSWQHTPGIKIFLLTRERISLLHELSPSLDLREYEGRLGKGSSCYCASHSGRLAHYTWVQTSGHHRIERAGRDEEVRPGQFWIYECRTSSAERGLGIYPSVLNHVVRDHFQLGLQEGVIYTTPQNLASQRGILKAGFRYDQTLRSIRVGRHYFPIGSPVINDRT